MIFYTLTGPGHTLVIHEDKLVLIQKGLSRIFSRRPVETHFSLKELDSFAIIVPKFIIWGRLEWTTTDGTRASFRFTTNYEMVKKIERYMQKKIEKNQERAVVFKKREKDGPKKVFEAAA